MLPIYGSTTPSNKHYEKDFNGFSDNDDVGADV